MSAPASHSLHLVTGAAGFLGHRLALRLLEHGCRVRALDAGHPGGGYNPFHREQLVGRVEWMEGDLNDPATCARAVAGVTVIHHLAGNGSHAASMSQPLIDLEANLAATETLLEAVRNAGSGARVLFASTRQLYGRADRLPVSEDAPLRMVDVNAVHKRAAEDILGLYHRVHGVPTVILRLSNVFGPGLRISDAVQGFYGPWIRALLDGRSFEVWGGSQVRDLVWVDDAVEAFWLAASADGAAGRIYNIGSGLGTALIDLARAMVSATGDGASFTVREMPAHQARIEIGDFIADITRARTELGWAPTRPLEAMIHETLAYYREHRARYLGAPP